MQRPRSGAVGSEVGYLTGVLTWAGAICEMVGV